MILAAENQSSGGASLLPLLMLVGLFAVMYFLVIRPQSKRRKEMQSMQQNVGPGSEIVTVGGLYGTVVAVDDDSVTLEVSPGVTNRYAKGAIGKVLTSAPAATPAEEMTEDIPEATETSEASEKDADDTATNLTKKQP